MVDECIRCGKPEGIFNGYCIRCKLDNDEKKEKEIDFKLAERHGFVKRYDSIMCPYCGEVLKDDIHEFLNDDTFECEVCGKESDMELEMIAGVTTSKRDDDKDE